MFAFDGTYYQGIIFTQIKWICQQLGNIVLDGFDTTPIYVGTVL